MIAEQFASLDIECLIKTAVELWEEIDISDLSQRQQEVLDRARSAVYADHAGQAPTFPVVTTLIEAGSLKVWVLRRWDRDHDKVTLWPDENAALMELAAYARPNWVNVTSREDVPDQPPADDREAVRLYYGPKGERGDEDYTIYADEVHASVPPNFTRLATATIRDGWLVCPHCGGRDSIVQIDSATRKHRLSPASDDVVGRHMAHGDFVVDGYQCTTCNHKVDVPFEVQPN